jgi:hypothetical protein
MRRQSSAGDVVGLGQLPHPEVQFIRWAIAAQGDLTEACVSECWWEVVSGGRWLRRFRLELETGRVLEDRRRGSYRVVKWQKCLAQTSWHQLLPHNLEVDW